MNTQSNGSATPPETGKVSGRQYLKVPEAAELIRVSTKTVWRLIAKGLLPFCGIGDRVVIDKDDLFAFMNKVKQIKAPNSKMSRKCIPNKCRQQNN